MKEHHGGTIWHSQSGGHPRVANVNERRRIPMRAIRAVVKQIADAFHPDKIILFGSYAYGKPRPELDVIVHTPQQIQERLEMGDFFFCVKSQLAAR